MLTPDYLENAPDEMVKLWQQVEDDILRDIGRRIGKMDGITDTAEWQAFRLAEMRGLRTDVTKILARYSGKSEATIRKILQQAGTEALASDDAIYRAAGLTPGDVNGSAALANLLNAGYRQTSGTWRNLTATTASTVTQQFENSLSRAWLQVSSGAFDYKTAIKRSVDDLSQTMQGVTYPSGHHDSLEVACRRAVLTGVNQTAGKLQVARMDEMGCDFVEVSAHAGARPEHAVWQGKVYHRGGDIVYHGERYADFENATHYGSGDGLCGWNCRHNFYPFFPGLSERAYGDKELAQLSAKTETYNGQQYTKYEISQMQRTLERKVRSAKKQYITEQAAGIDSTNAAVKYRSAQQQLKQFARNTGGRVDSSRTSVSGFGHSQASKAVWAAKGFSSQVAQNRSKGTNRYVSDSGAAVIQKPLYDKLVKPVIKAGGMVLRGSPEVEKHLQSQNATASTLGDVIMFRSDATTSDVLEETHHFWQTRSGMNADKPEALRSVLNEIDAKEYLISVADKYKIPEEETKLTKQQLDGYRGLLKILKGE